MQFKPAALAILTVFAMVSAIRGAPFESKLDKRIEPPSKEQLKDYIAIGYRYVSKEVAMEYNKVWTLTAVPARGVRLGEGAYIAPNLKDYKPPEGFWRCQISAHKTEFNNLPKLWVPEDKQSKPRSEKDLVALNAYIHSQKKSVRGTILFSTMKPGDPGLQMVVPPAFLKDRKSTAVFDEKAFDIYAACEETTGNIMDPETSKVNWRIKWPDVGIPKPESTPKPET